MDNLRLFNVAAGKSLMNVNTGDTEELDAMMNAPFFEVMEQIMTDLKDYLDEEGIEYQTVTMRDVFFGIAEINEEDEES